MNCFRILSPRARRASIVLTVMAVLALGTFIDRLAQPDAALVAAQRAIEEAPRPAQQA